MQLSEAGWLKDLSECSEEITAEVEEIDELIEEHWDIINLTRKTFMKITK